MPLSPLLAYVTHQQVTIFQELVDAQKSMSVGQKPFSPPLIFEKENS